MKFQFYIISIRQISWKYRITHKKLIKYFVTYKSLLKILYYSQYINSNTNSIYIIDNHKIWSIKYEKTIQINR